MFDCIIRNGTLVDPTAKRREQGDIAVLNGKIVPFPTNKQEARARQEIDAAGLLVLPGLIDFHCHFSYGVTDNGVPLDSYALPSGVTTAVDAGSTGVSNYRVMATYLTGAATRNFACLNVSNTGLASYTVPENMDPALIDKERIIATVRNAKGHLLGLKVRLSRELVKEFGIKPLEKALDIAEELGCPVVVHVTDLTVKEPAVLNLLRAGDVYCHVFHGIGNSILTDKGALHPAVFTARERGVLFDSCHGSMNFALATAEAALREGFSPDIISTDVSFKTLYTTPVYGMPFILSKFLALGLPLMDVLAAATAAPAKALGLEGEIGTLQPGACADIALFALEQRDRPVSFPDIMGQTCQGNELLIPMLTMRAGAILYRNYAFI